MDSDNKPTFIEKYIDKSIENLETKIDSNKELFNRQFDSFDIKFDNFEEDLQRGFKSINDNINRLKDDLNREIEHKIDIKTVEIKNSADNSINEIKNNSNIKKLLGDTLEDAIYFVRHPRMFVAIVVSMILLALSPYVAPLVVYSLNNKKELKKEQKIEEQQKSDKKNQATFAPTSDTTNQ